MLLLWVGSTEIFIHSSKVRLYLQDRDGRKLFKVHVLYSQWAATMQGAFLQAEEMAERKAAGVL